MSSNISFSLAAGSRLGPYTIVAFLGAGGMGEVYRAHDSRLKRDVALKILRRSPLDAGQLARFSREARAAGSLNHPNIVAVFDVGTEGGLPFVVTELLEGETLQARLDRGPIPYRKGVEFGTQIAQALDAAHAKGIWHRDVKPANIFITTDARVKLLDFGIAKLDDREGRRGPQESTAETAAGEIRGTAGYMAPEQVLGTNVDHRADIFALGAVLYEIFTGTRAFHRPSAVQTMTAVLEEDPADPLTLNARLPASAAAVVRRCLAKDTEERFQSARDLAFALHQLCELTEKTSPLRAPSVLRRKVVTAMLAAALPIAGIGVGLLLPRQVDAPVFDQLTFRRERIGGARFVSGGTAVVYSDTRHGMLRLDDLEVTPASSHSLPYSPGTDVLSARGGDLALWMRRRWVLGERFAGTLAVARAGGAPVEIAEHVEDADWDPSGEELVTVRSTGDATGQSWIEYKGRRLYETVRGESIRFLRFSRDGRRLAFLEDPDGRGAGGYVRVMDIDGKPVTLTERWSSVRGLAWSIDGKEIWFAAGGERTNRTLRAVSLSGAQRSVLAAPGSLTLWDIAPDGRALVTRDEERSAVVGVPPGETTERDLSLFDDAGVARLSNDGGTLLFGDRFGIYTRPTDGSELPKRLELRSGGWADDLSPDGRTVLATVEDRLIRVPTGPGEPQAFPAHGIAGYRGALWFADGRRVLFNAIAPSPPPRPGGEAESVLRSYIQDVDGGPPKPLTDHGTWAVSISPNGEWAAAIGTEPGITLWPVAGGAPRTITGAQPGERPVAWSEDGRSLWLFRRGDVPAPVVRLEIDTGRRTPWKTLAPPDTAGVYSITNLAITSSGNAYFYSYAQMLSQLYLVRGLR